MSHNACHITYYITASVEKSMNCFSSKQKGIVSDIDPLYFRKKIDGKIRYTSQNFEVLRTRLRLTSIFVTYVLLGFSQISSEIYLSEIPVLHMI